MFKQFVLLLSILLGFVKSQNATNSSRPETTTPITFPPEPIVDEAEVARYVEIINNGTRQALNYVQPRDASQYRATRDDLIPTDYGSYNFIVIGAGAAGAVVANRLTEDNYTVLLLEAGHVENEFVGIPGIMSFAAGTEYNWGYKSVPQRNCCLGMTEQRCVYHRGRGLGGSTIINALVYARGAMSDYERWGEQNEGWSYDDVLPYFIKSEDSHINGVSDYHGVGGPYTVEYANYTTPHIEAFLAANEELGYTQIDYNGPSHLGVSRCHFNLKNGRRLSTGKAFIKPIMDRPNLSISTNSYVTRILVSPITHIAYGVEFYKNNRLFEAYVDYEVILSAGAIGSPQILMQSGIGPIDHLFEIGIPVIQPSPVGNNLQDHIAIFGLSIITNTSIQVHSMEDNVREFLRGRGVYSMPGNHGAVAFYKTNFSKHESADVEFIFITGNRSSDFFQKNRGFTDETTRAIIGNQDNSKTFTVFVVAQHPDSVGTVRLASNDNFAYPLIDPRLLADSEDYDIRTLYAGIQQLERILGTNAMKAIDARFKPIVLPNCAQHSMFTRDYWYCFIRQTSDEIFHPVGTCKMGSFFDFEAVVNNRLRVYGIPNLRVADASVVPFSLSGHTSAVSVMIGERAADFIKEDYAEYNYDDDDSDDSNDDDEDSDEDDNNNGIYNFY